MRRLLIATSAFILAAVVLVVAGAVLFSPEWSGDELKRIQSLSLASLPPLRPDASNRFSDDPAAAALGKALFFDTRLSANGAISCATCHKPDRQFQDDLPVGHGMADGARRTMPIAGTAFFPFLFWDGRKDSQWSQALGPLENPAEHGADRTMVVRLVTNAYKDRYEALFGTLPDLTDLPEHAMPQGPEAAVAAWSDIPAARQAGINRAYANIGKSIAAFERTVAPPLTRFDTYAQALTSGDQRAAYALLSAQEQAGLKLFIGQGNCVSCHNGPLLTDNAFHNLALPKASLATDGGRSVGATQVKADQFNCLGPFSDADPSSCAELKFIETISPNLVGTFRSPSLRGVALRPPYMHAGQFVTLRDVLNHYNQAPVATLGKSELKPLHLSDEQLNDIEAFLKTLDPLPAAGGIPSSDRP